MADTFALDAPHGELDCASTEALLAETTADLAELTALEAALQAELAAVRAENARYRDLFSEVRKRKGNTVAERDGLQTQVDILMEELAAAEQDAVPVGTFTHAAVGNAEVLAAYRRAARVRTGPLPQTVVDALDAVKDEVQQAMTAAATEVIDRTLRREIRRRNRVRNAAARRAAARRAQ